VIRHALHVGLTVLAAAILPATARALSPDYSGWQALLTKYVVVDGGTRKVPLDTRVDYGQVFMDEDQFSEGPARRLDEVRAQLLAVPPAQMNREERLAWAINTYNFLVFDRIARNVVVKGKKQLWRYGDVREVVSGAGSFYETPVVEVEGRRLSLTEFQRRYVYGDSTPQYERRATPGDPRLLFALSHGTLGGPPLMPRAYRPDSLESQLDRATRTTLALPRFVVWDRTRRQLDVSDYLGWNPGDFGGLHRLVPFLERWAPREVSQAIRKERVVNPSHFVPYDWMINHATRHNPGASARTH
jgi:hypothetical protein